VNIQVFLPVCPSSDNMIPIPFTNPLPVGYDDKHFQATVCGSKVNNAHDTLLKSSDDRTSTSFSFLCSKNSNSDDDNYFHFNTAFTLNKHKVNDFEVKEMSKSCINPITIEIVMKHRSNVQAGQRCKILKIKS